MQYAGLKRGTTVKELDKSDVRANTSGEPQIIKIG